jgi:hypothetical protein
MAPKFSHITALVAQPFTEKYFYWILCEKLAKLARFGHKNKQIKTFAIEKH